MFVRKKKNRSGSTSVVIVNKDSGKTRYVKTIGISSDAQEINELCRQGKEYIHAMGGQMDLFGSYEQQAREEELTDAFLSNIENVLLNGTQLILERLYKRIGFDKVDDDILKKLVIARLSQPLSKAATVDYLKSHFAEDIHLVKIYRYLDKLNDTQKDIIQQISVEHTRKVLGGQIGLVFYDVTTLYFESDYGDELRETGFSKDGKHAQPQIVLGLLVSRDGYPLAYSLFNGSQYEGYTMIPVVEDFVNRFRLHDFVVVADSGLMNKTNLLLLESGGHKYIIGARIKNETEEIKGLILSLEKQDGQFYEIQKSGNCRLIINYSEKRAKKDFHNREKGVKRLFKDFGKGKVTKENINKRGYNKFLELTDDVGVRISKDKIADDTKWDGFKGYLTNTDLLAKDVYEQYTGLWVIERAYRVTKGTLDLRPVFHFTPRRIEAHICICFIAYKVYKELERVLRINQINISADKCLNIAKTITTIKIKMPLHNRTKSKTLILTDQHKKIAELFTDEFWLNQR